LKLEGKKNYGKTDQELTKIICKIFNSFLSPQKKEILSNLSSKNGLFNIEIKTMS